MADWMNFNGKMDEEIGELVVLDTRSDQVENPLDYLSDYTIFLFCRTGHLEFRFNHTLQCLKPGGLAFLTIHEEVFDVSCSPEFDGTLLLISHRLHTDYRIEEEWAIKGFMLMRQKPVIMLSPEQEAHFQELIGRFRQINARPQHLFRRQITGHLLQCFYYEMLHMQIQDVENEPVETTNQGAAVFSKFIQMACIDAEKHRDVVYYADRLFVTPKYLSELCIKQTAKPASAWINSAATQIAASLLRDEQYTLQDIADRMAFSSLPHFCRFIKKSLGMTPSEYRKQNIK